MGSSKLHFLAGTLSNSSLMAAEHLLLSGQANPNQRNEENVTPTHVAAAWGNGPMLSLLLSFGGDCSIRDEDGFCPLDLALHHGHSNCVSIIRAHERRKDANRKAQAVKTENGSEEDFLSEDFSCCSLYPTASHERFSEFHNQSLWSQEKEKQTLIHVRSLSDHKLREDLVARGFEAGPVTSATRKLYERRLFYMLQDEKSGKTSKHRRKYSRELEEILQTGNYNSGLDEERVLVEEFTVAKKGWREGNQKMSFCYLLIDPRLLKEGSFRSFLDAIFYVGKGKKARPHQHLVDAVITMRNPNCKKMSDKMSRILDLWKSNLGVVSLHIFHNTCPVEAYSREALMIDAIGMNNLTNIKKGDYYGCLKTWSVSRRRRLGSLLLSRAFTIFLQEGPRQLFPDSIIPTDSPGFSLRNLFR